ncbi:flagellar hook-basal body complex protein FliE [Pantoea sp. 1.19]|uniref:flagellar hook-basal body complex protein FliE n=1 Tax=Pantoea sp. 1.19 TaxID=1925589 RepID=UPI000948BF5C|nr:flagellar hook-basal body complex protein FliE [Pantoea sp. 1.19]
MAIQGIEGVVQQLALGARQASGVSAEGGAQLDFAAALKSALGQISDVQQSARQQAQDFSLGKSGVALNDVMIDLQKSSVSMQMGIQVRNKLVQAYTDIMNMQV